MIAAAALGAMSVPALALTPAGARPKAPAPLVISTMSTSRGTVLVTKGGRTLYTLQASSTPCASACWKIWPRALLTRGQQPKAGAGVQASQLSTRAVSGGTQVTYKGKLVYWFSGDAGSGQVNGNISDAWGKWTAARSTPGASSSNSNSGSGGSNSGTGGASF